jgi:LuxR family maltose regulon positive regulatory protein
MRNGQKIHLNQFSYAMIGSRSIIEENSVLDNLLRTKLYPPHKKTPIVHRQRLIDQLIKGLLGPLTLVSSTAGSGKTTLICEWRAGYGEGTPVAWLSIDAGDNDPSRFFQYLIASLDSIKPGLMGEFSPVFQSIEPSQFETLLTLMINSLDGVPQDFILVLDDYHMIENETIHNALTFLVDHLPAQMHLVILTRIDPPFPLARLRSRGQLIEIRTQDLRFTLKETATFLNQIMGLNISDHNLSLLETRTEGWVTGLQMAALSMQGRQDLGDFIAAFTGSHRFVIDYLTDEILNRQPEPVRSFLLRTSILDRFHAPLCQAVTDCEDAQAMLAGLEDANLFLVPLDDERHWYRYHHLFADLLRASLRQQDPQLPDDLRQRAACWCGDNNLLEDAIEYSLAAGDFAFAAVQIEKVIRSMLVFDNRDTLRNWIDRLPPELVDNHPWLGTARALALTAAGQLDPARRLLSHARRKLAKSELATAEQTLLEGLIAGIDAWMAEKENDLDATLTLAKQAMEKLPINSPIYLFAAILAGDVFFLRGDLIQAEQARQQVLQAARQSGRLTYQVLMLLGLGHIYFLYGQLEQASGFYLSVTRLVLESHIYSHYLASAKVALAGVSLIRNQLDDAAMLAKEARDIYLSSPVGNTRSTPSLMMLARVHLAKGELGQAQELLSQAEAAMQSVQQYPNVLAEWNDFRVRLWLAQGDLERCQHWVETIQGEMTDLTGYCGQLNAGAMVRILLAQACSGQSSSLEKALVLVQELAAASEAQGQNNRLIETLILQARSLLADNKPDQANQAFQKAIKLASPENILRPFVDERKTIQELLLFLKNKHTIQNPFIDELLNALSPAPQSKSTSPGLVEPLTEREKDVLRLMAAGLSNPEIGQELYLSLNTIKTHVRGIYGKLGVNNRTQAANLARELDLV